MRLAEIEIAVALGLAGLVAFYFWKMPKGSFNPASQNNIVTGAVNSAGASVTGDEYFTLGGWLFDATHPAVVAERDSPIAAPAPAGDSFGAWLYDLTHPGMVAARDPQPAAPTGTVADYDTSLMLN